jgi:hypothetical protein
MQNKTMSLQSIERVQSQRQKRFKDTLKGKACIPNTAMAQLRRCALVNAGSIVSAAKKQLFVNLHFWTKTMYTAMKYTNNYMNM